MTIQQEDPATARASPTPGTGNKKVMRTLQRSQASNLKQAIMLCSTIGLACLATSEAAKAPRTTSGAPATQGACRAGFMHGMWSGAGLVRPKAPHLSSSPRMPATPAAPHDPHFSEPRRAGRTNRRFLLEPVALNYDDDEDLLGEDGARKRKWRIEPKAVIASVVWVVTALPMFMAQTALAAVTGGAIRGSVVPDSAREAPSRDSSRTERTERPVRPSERASDRGDRGDGEGMFSMERPRRAAAAAASKFPKIRIRDLDVTRDWEVGGHEVNKRDLAILGGVTAAAVAQNEVRKRFTGLGGPSGIYTTGFQVALYDSMGVMASFQRLAQRAETTTSAGLASLASNVCLELLRSLDSVVAAKSFSGRHPSPVEAEKEMHELGIRERKKWSYETTTQAQGPPPRMDPKFTSRGGQGGLMVVTLMVVCRKFDKALSRTVNSAQSLETALEKLATLVLERGGKNVLAVDVSWTPDDPADILTREELLHKWPDLMDF